MRYFLLIFFISLTACSPQNTSLNLDAPSQLIRVHIPSATEDWLPLVYDCADRSRVGLVMRTQNITSANISLRLNMPKDSDTSIYQIGEIELVVVSNAANPIEKLTENQVRAIFESKIHNWAELGGEDAEIQLWVYGQSDDLQVTFNETMLEKGKISSLARQAQNQAEMRREIAKDENALGIISQAQTDENLRVLHSLGDFPVLAVVEEELSDALVDILKCLQ